MIISFDEKYFEVNILKLLNNPSVTVDDCFNQSGVSLVLTKCLEEIGWQNISCCWIDFTSFATTMSYGNNFGFEALAINPKIIPEKEFVNNLNMYLSPCVKHFNENLKNMYFHPQFMDGTNIAYVSIIKKGEDKPTPILQCEGHVTKVSKLDNGDKLYDKLSLYSGMTKIEQTFVDVSEQIKSTQCGITECADYMHQLYRNHLLSEDARNKLTTCYIGIPCIAPAHNIDDNNFTSQTAGFIFIAIQNDLEIYSVLKSHDFYKLIYSELSIISRNLPYVMALQLKNRAKNEAIKSAKAAIMSRNMSHNLGSHVMAYLKQNLGSVIDIVKGNVIEKIVSNNQLNTQINLWKDYLNNEAGIGKKKEDENRYKNLIELPFLVGIGHFISYMQERQDYIATVSTDYVPYFSSLNFKDDIYDVLNPDLRYLRHTDRIGGRPDNILLSFIARSEGLQRPAYANILVYDSASVSLENKAEFDTLKNCCIDKRENDIVIKFRKFDGLNDAEFTPVTIEFQEQNIDIYRRKNDSHDVANEEDLNYMRSFNLSLPGGIAGRQAFFSIIENIIRNAAKHGAWDNTQEKRLEITFDVYDCSIEDSRFMGSEDSEPLQLKQYLMEHGYFNKKDSRDLYVLTITDNIPIESKKIEQLEDAIKQRYIYDDCSMVNENKGIKEIKISASWLRNLTHEEDEIDMAPILNVRLSNKCLQYIICIPKVKKYAIICPNPDLYNSEHLQSIYYYTEDSFKKERNKSFEVIAILDDDNEGKLYEEIRSRIIPISPNHIVKISDEDLKAIHAELKNQSCDKKLESKFQQSIDNMYARMYGIKAKEVITIIDDKVASSAKAKDLENIKGRVECLTGEDSSGILPPFVYKKHLETEKNFYDFLRTYVIDKGSVNLIFAEGISGGNSTDRLVRGVECNFTTEWYYKHLNAMRKRIAIFDERLFSKTTNLTDNELVGVDNSIIEAIAKGAKETPDEYLKTTEVQELRKRTGLDVEGCAYRSVNEYVKDMIVSSKCQYAKSHLIAVNHYKNICIYNIIFNNATQEFDIYGYKKIESNLDDIKFKIENVGKILRNADVIDIKFEGKGFDYLSIHQGLLDKIYHQWGIADGNKCRVTQALYDKVMLKEETIFIENSRYLPGLIIHSGRAKPSGIDMPQRQPFIQYASLDHAVSDCKYTLVELLDNARYE